METAQSDNSETSGLLFGIHREAGGLWYLIVPTTMGVYAEAAG